MKFKLDFSPPSSDHKIDLKDKIYLIGSCFSDQIGDKLSENKFNVLSNPFGTIYNPHSIFKLLKGELNENQITKSQEVFYHWDTQGDIFGIDKAEVQASLKERLERSNKTIKGSNFLFITLGTAWVYILNDSSEIVANCHKQPSSHFQKRLLSTEEITEDFKELHQYLSTINPEINIVFTVSPVRHVKDGLVENNRSKSILIESVHLLCETYKNVSYFPSYEIMIDELRDYRFFKEDLIHPSDEAVHYIWDQFTKSFFSTESLEFLIRWQKLNSALSHRPLHPSSASHQKFLKQTLQKLEDLNDSVDLSAEINSIKTKLS
ncbi:MAG: GSCFA domain-containing protein [Bacteroidota bacterium]